MRIVDYAIGHTGSTHDSYAFQETRLFKEHETILRADEWVWADSAYPATRWCVPPFKKPSGGELTRSQKSFNYHLSRIRIRSEHTIGLLKGRFQSLRELRIQISSRKRHLWAIIWIRCCIILHNLIIIFEGNDNDSSWRRKLTRLGLGQSLTSEDDGDGDNSDGEEDNEDVETDEDYIPALPDLDIPIGEVSEGYAFRQRVMEGLFNSDTYHSQQ